MSFQIALFDLDGTVLDTLDDLTAAVNHALSAAGMPTHTKERVCSYVGNGIGKLIEHAVPAGTAPDAREHVFAEFKTYYAAHCADSTKPYGGIPSLLQGLRAAGVKTALISNKADFAVQELAVQYFDGLFDLVLGERAEIPRKPAPDMVYHVLNRLNISPSEAVFIGDSDVDVKTAQNAGVAGIFVTWGFRSEACLREAGATRVVHTPAALAQMILKNEKG